jgi:hypothetical protein
MPLAFAVAGFITKTIMNITLLAIMLASLAAAPAGQDSAGDNPVFKDLLAQGIKMSDGTTVKLRSPIIADGLDAAGQRAALAKVATARNPVKDILRKSYDAPVVTKVRNVNEQEDEKPFVRTIDVWFVIHGDWDKLVSKGFLESMTGDDKGKGHIVAKSGELTKEEMRKRKLSVKTTEGYEERFLYTTFSLFERVQVSATRFSALTKGKDSILVAGKIDPRFDKDSEYPNQWCPLLRDVQAEIKPGAAHAFSRAGGYAKITRLKEPAGAVFVEFHLVYEEPYAWFDGVSLVQQKVPLMVKEKARGFRRKLTVASDGKGETKEKP